MKRPDNLRLMATLALCAMIGASCTDAPAPKSSNIEPPSRAQWTQSCQDWDEWDKAGPPFRLLGNTYYVGTCGISAILITGETGHVLIDGGTQAGADLIAKNIETLGFALSDVQVLLHSHEHFDHVAGLARLQKRSGARLIASARAAPVLASGQASPDDPQYAFLDPFPAAIVDEILGSEGRVNLGTLALQAIDTPGHTQGALSWQWQSCEGGKCFSIVYADSLTPISDDLYKFSDHRADLAAYRAGLARLAALDCDLLITPHPSASEMRQKMIPPATLTGGQACKKYASQITAQLDQRLASEASGGTS